MSAPDTFHAPRTRPPDCPRCHTFRTIVVSRGDSGWDALWRCLHCCHTFVARHPFDSAVVLAYVKAGGKVMQP